MYSYDARTGDLVNSEDEASRNNTIITLLKARRYGHAPEVAGMLHRALGPAHDVKGFGYKKARAEVRRVLDGLGLFEVEVADVAQGLSEDWHLVLGFTNKDERSEPRSGI